MTTIIHTSFKKRKAKKPTAKQRQLQSDWEKLLEKYEPKKPVTGTSTKATLRRRNRKTKNWLLILHFIKVT